MKTPLLSICIATYNRADYIGETLNSIIPQLNDDVELLVVDGASTDNTEAVVSEFVQKESRLRYIRLSAKGGIDYDYDQAVKFAKGKYCWLFTDDDLLKAGSIDHVLFEISKGYSLIIVNSEVWNKNFSSMLFAKHLDTRQTVYDIFELDAFFQHCISYISFIGSVVIKKTVWEERNKAKYFGTEFIHIGVIFQKLLPDKICIIKKPYIKIRYGNAQWSSRAFEIWMIKWPILLWSFKLISHNSKKKLINEEPWRSLKKLFVHRGLSSYNINIFNKLSYHHNVSYAWLLSAKLISLFPVKLANTILIMFYNITNRTKDLIYYDLLQTSNTL
ncbi:MAG: glycosyltransferase family 2 protein [Desulfamplus sp.]|nr:glycosyltransferase family 2 protein [Desulfamplus sp.]